MKEDALLVPDLIDKIYKNYEVDNKRPKKRFSRLGASGIGKDCLRAVFYSWRGFTQSKFPGRIQRLFQTGHLQEDRIVADLERAGLEVWAATSDGRQYTFLDESGHLIAKVDGVVRGVFPGSKEKMLLEIKTMSDNAFSKLEKGGIYKQDHLYQIHTGMWFLGFRFGLYVVLNKNDEGYHIEVVERQKRIISDLQNRVKTLILGYSSAPPRISDDATDFGCKWCNHRSVCMEVTAPVKSCRSCSFVRPINNGEWLCEKHQISLNMTEQVEGCQDYTMFGK